MLGAVTYPEPSVADAISQCFVPLQVNTQDASSRPLVERFRQFWTPDLRILAADAFELYRWNGYLPPYELLPQLLVGQAHACLRMTDEAGAAAIYEDVLRRFPTSQLGPEAQYFLAVSKYKQSHKPEDLLGGWHKLQGRYPDSPWRVKQSFTEER
jgi:hypothetical protein